MVISDSLVWLHIPKTAGDSTLEMFKLLDCEWPLMHEHKDPQKHSTLEQAREWQPGSERLPVIANLRRLPELVLSYFHHMQRHGREEEFANGRPFGELDFGEYLRYLLDHPDTQSHDWLLDHYLGDREVDHWLRVADLAESFIGVIGAYHPISPRATQEIRSLRENVGAYEKDLTRWFSPEEMAALYGNCPRWSKAEQREYGNLLMEELAWGR